MVVSTSTDAPASALGVPARHSHRARTRSPPIWTTGSIVLTNLASQRMASKCHQPGRVDRGITWRQAKPSQPIMIMRYEKSTTRPQRQAATEAAIARGSKASSSAPNTAAPATNANRVNQLLPIGAAADWGPAVGRGSSRRRIERGRRQPPQAEQASAPADVMASQVPEADQHVVAAFPTNGGNDRAADDDRGLERSARLLDP